VGSVSPQQAGRPDIPLGLEEINPDSVLAIYTIAKNKGQETMTENCCLDDWIVVDSGLAAFRLPTPKVAL
jgi:hypothetical protein